jgi:hypothetical protein
LIQTFESNRNKSNSDFNSNDHDNSESLILGSQNLCDDNGNIEKSTNVIVDEQEGNESSSMDDGNDGCCTSEYSTLEEHSLEAPTEEECNKKSRQINRKIKISVSVTGDDQVNCETNISSDPVPLDQREDYEEVSEAPEDAESCSKNLTEATSIQSDNEVPSTKTCGQIISNVSKNNSVLENP